MDNKIYFEYVRISHSGGGRYQDTEDVYEITSNASEYQVKRFAENIIYCPIAMDTVKLTKIDENKWRYETVKAFCD